MLVFLLVFVACVVFVLLLVPNAVLSIYAVVLEVFVFLLVPNDVLSIYAVILEVFVDLAVLVFLLVFVLTEVAVALPVLVL